MAAKSKKRLSKIENKLSKLEKLELKDVFCSICHSILVEPVTLPCYHAFCLRCFNGSVENNALCCPLCRLRIGSWLRIATKQKNLVNIDLWEFIKLKFSREIDIKTKGEDIHLPEDKPALRLSAPGEIRLEYENELKRLRAERLQLEQKHLQETELLIKKIQIEEEEAHRKYLEAVKRDEILAQEMQHGRTKNRTPLEAQCPPEKQRVKRTTLKPRLKATRIDSFLSKVKATPVKESPLLTDDNTSSTDNSTPKKSVQSNNRGSPELIPNYGKLLKNFLDKKIKNGPVIWNKENGESAKDKEEPEISNSKEVEQKDDKKGKSKHGMQSLLVSLPLPYPGILQHKPSENRSIETGSVDSMRQELCYFKPIEATTPTNFTINKGLPLRVPSVRVEQEPNSPGHVAAPSQEQYLEGLCRLRNLSLTKNLPSAFVLVLNALKIKKDCKKCVTNTRHNRVKRVADIKPANELPVKRNAPTRIKQSGIQIDGVTTLKPKKNLRRTRSMGSISKDENETTPKKAKLKERKAASERRPYLRSDSKRTNAKKEFNSPSPIPESINNNKINLAVKNLSSPLKNCDLKKIVHEQLRIEKLIEQEKNDFELARKMDAEWNARRTLRRPPTKRQIAISAALRPAKKLKV